MRFTMQLAEVTTPVAPGPIDANAVARLGDAFEATYASLYGKDAGFREAGMQIITYRMRARARLPIRPELPHFEHGSKRATPRSRRRAFLDVRRGWQDIAVYDYRDLGRDDRLIGPAVVETPTTTVALPEGCAATLDHAWQYGHPLFGHRLKRRLHNAAHSRFRLGEICIPGALQR